MTKDEVIELVEEDAIFYDGLDEAVIGVAERCGMPTVVCYDYDKLIECLMKSFNDEGLSEEDKFEMAIEWYDYNINGGFIGEYTPIVVRVKSDQ